MPVYRDMSTRPYVVLEIGAIPALHGQRREISAHKTAQLACRRAMQLAGHHRDFWPDGIPWLIYEVVDARTGSLIRTYR